jgi:F-type H+-transporting ATPase subunit h
MAARQVSRVFTQFAASSLNRATRTTAAVQVRGFIAPTFSRRADFVQELYLKELKAYKPTPTKESDSEGQVKTFAVPKTPASPEEADLASSLMEYESLSAEVEGSEAAAGGATAAPTLPDWFEEEPEDNAHGH